MSDIRLDTTGDIDLTTGGAELLELNTEIVAQRIAVAVALRQGEWKPNLILGVPYRQTFLRVKNNKAFIDSYMGNYISSVDGVDDILDYSSVIDDKRQLQITFRVRTASGVTTNFLTGVL